MKISVYLCASTLKKKREKKLLLSRVDHIVLIERNEACHCVPHPSIISIALPSEESLWLEYRTNLKQMRRMGEE